MQDKQDPGSALLAPSIDDRVMTCPECGHELKIPAQDSLDHTVQTLIAVCDVLVIKALEKMGTYIVRAGATRGRWNEFEQSGLPQHLAHTKWPPSDEIVTKALKGAWAIVPLILDTHGPYKFDANKAVAVLDRYVHDLAVTGAEHDLDVLAYRLRVSLDLPVFIIHSAA